MKMLMCYVFGCSETKKHNLKNFDERIMTEKSPRVFTLWSLL